jgi:hypothetical protein
MLKHTSLTLDCLTQSELTAADSTASFSAFLIVYLTAYAAKHTTTAAAAVACSWKNKKATLKWHQWLAVFLPCFEWIIGYDWRRNLLWDVLAGCSVGFMVVSGLLLFAAVDVCCCCLAGCCLLLTFAV